MATFPTLTTTDPKGVQAWSSQLVRSLSRAVRNFGVGTLTLELSTTSTTVSDQLAAPGGGVLLFPTTSEAAAVVATTYIPPETILDGSFTVEHADSITEDRTFLYLIVESEGDTVT